ncbi:MAG: hypothetical protein QM802_11515 [Agriterribacter sp.]
MECRYQPLYQGEEGYVVLCLECACFQVAFASILITLVDYDFHAFCRFIETRHKTCPANQSGNGKSIAIETPAEGICFLLTPQELCSFHEMLEKARDEIKALQLIKLFNP